MSSAVANRRIVLFQGLTYLLLAGPLQVMPRVGILAWISVRRIPRVPRVPHRRLVGAAFEDPERKGHVIAAKTLTFHIYMKPVAPTFGCPNLSCFCDIGL